jgi:hypothetical protein
MIKHEDGSVTLTKDEASMMALFIDNRLDAMWDQHTNIYITDMPLEDGRRRMHHGAYDLLQELQK